MKSFERPALITLAVLFASACSDADSPDDEVAVTSQAATGSEVYVSPAGSDANSGAASAPFRTLAKAYAAAGPGTTIYVRGGTYTPTSQFRLDRSGASGNPIRVFAYPGEKPVLDGSAMTGTWNAGVPLRVTGSWNHVRGLEIKNGPEGGATMDGSASNNTFEALDVHHNGRASRYEGKGITLFGTSSNNLILDCDSHHNRDLDNGNADGFQVGTAGTGNVLRGNRAWRNSDDGYDFWNGAPLLLENNWAWENGLDDSLRRLGDGNGFKLGGQHAGKSSGGHTLRNNVAWKNAQNGFDENSSSRPNTLDNNTAWSNATYNYSFWERENVFRNNVSFAGRAATRGTSTTNSWNLPVTVDAADFASLDDGVARSARSAAGLLPDSGFLRLVAGSDLIDKGTNVGLPVVGSRPDLGAYEYGAAATTPTTETPTTETPTVAQNLIKNGGFERQGESWEDWGGTTIDDSTKRSGSYSLRLGTGEGGRGQIVAGLRPNTRYVLTAVARASSSVNESCYVGLYFRDASGNQITTASSSRHVTATSWTTHRIELTSPASFANAKAWTWKNAGAAYCWFDDVTLIAN